ncbi:hypothetical protein BC629DRAFT_1442239 [Irpex lacteus]|nr:hypothetical protein BC629DRAFT_1442239 [Irpex lacteus]
MSLLTLAAIIALLILFISLIGTYILTAANVVFFYECVITLCEEVNVIWRRKWTTMTWIYAITRYSTLLLNILTFGLGGNTISVLYLQAVVAAQLIFRHCRGYTPFNIVSVLGAQVICLYCFLHFEFMHYQIAVFLLNLVPFATSMFSDITARIIVDSEVCTDIFTGSAGLNLLYTVPEPIS